VSRSDRQRRHYDELIRTRRPTRYGLSCGYHDRFDPALLERRPALRRAMERLFDLILPPMVGTLLDIGCGTATYWPLLVGRCHRLLGTDLSPAMVAEGRRHQRARGACLGGLLCCDSARLPLASGSVDLVLSIDTLHHLEELDRVMEEVWRVLRPGGELVAVEPNVINPVVFLAHLIPPEERGAVWPNHPLAQLRAMERRFGEVEVRPVTYVSGLENELALKLVDLVDPLLRVPPFSLISLRRIYRARRR
jgi:SAM-dependent methyltransferase